MKKLVVGARIVLGLIFAIFGLNFFFPFLPMPEMVGKAGAFMGALGATGYMFYLLKATELVGGLMLLAGRYVPLALTLLAPVVVNIFLFNLILEPSGIVMGVVLVVLEIFLAWSYRGSFAGVLNAKAKASG